MDTPPSTHRIVTRAVMGSVAGDAARSRPAVPARDLRPTHACGFVATVVVPAADCSDAVADLYTVVSDVSEVDEGGVVG